MANSIVYRPEAHQNIIDGKCRAIAWGLSQDAHFRILQAPYTFDCIIDGRAALLEKEQFQTLTIEPPEYLEDQPLEQTVIIVFADPKQFGDEITRQIQSFGDFLVTLPYEPSQHADVPEFLTKIDSSLTAATQYEPNPDVVLLLLPNLHQGGADRQMTLLAQGLCVQNKSVVLVTHGPDAKGTEAWSTAMDMAGVKRCFAPPLREVVAKDRFQRHPKLAQLLPPRLFNLYLALCDAIEQHRPALCISFLDNANMLLALAKREYSIPTIVLSGRSQAPVDVPGLKTMWNNKVMLAMYKATLDSPQCIFSCNSSSGAMSYGKWFNTDAVKIPVVKNAVFIEPFKPLDVRQELGLEADSLLVVGVMRLVETKRPDAFVRIISALKTTIPNVHGLLLGSGHLMEAIRKQVSHLGAGEYMHLLGAKDNAIPYMLDSDAMLHTSEVEGMANTLLEADAIGLPVFAFYSPQTQDAVSKAPLHMAEEANEEALVSLLEQNLNRHISNNLPIVCSEDTHRMARVYLELC